MYKHSHTTFVIITMAVAFWIIIPILLAIEQQTQCRVLIISAACLFVSISPAELSRITYGWVWDWDTSIHSLSVYIQFIDMHCQLHKQTKDYENLFVRRCWKCPNTTRPDPSRLERIQYYVVGRCCLIKSIGDEDCTRGCWYTLNIVPTKHSRRRQEMQIWRHFPSHPPPILSLAHPPPLCHPLPSIEARVF